MLVLEGTWVRVNCFADFYSEVKKKRGTEISLQGVLRQVACRRVFIMQGEVANSLLEGGCALCRDTACRCDSHRGGLQPLVCSRAEQTADRSIQEPCWAFHLHMTTFHSPEIFFVQQKSSFNRATPKLWQYYKALSCFPSFPPFLWLLPSGLFSFFLALMTFEKAHHASS